MSPNKDKSPTFFQKWRFGFLLLGIVIIYTLVEIFFFYCYKKDAFGDSFEAINALFSGLAFAGLIYTIYLQKEELGLQRAELKMTRGELKGQKEEFKIQNETLKIQRFENTFFQLISLHHQIVSGINMVEKYTKNTQKKITNASDLFRRGTQPDITTETDERIINGREVFKKRYFGLYHQIKDSLTTEEINTQYLICYEQFQSDAGHYFRNLYRIIKFIDNSTFNDEEKYSYTSMIRAQLSDYELLWLFYNCISENGDVKFKPLIERYAIFKNIPIDKLANVAHQDLYKEGSRKKQNI